MADYHVELYPHNKAPDASFQVIGFSIEPPLEAIYDPGILNNANREDNGGRYLQKAIIHHGDEAATYGSASFTSEPDVLLEYAKNTFEAMINPMGNFTVTVTLHDPSAPKPDKRAARLSKEQPTPKRRLVEGVRSALRGRME